MLLINLIFDFCVVIVQAGCTPRAWCVTCLLTYQLSQIKKGGQGMWFVKATQPLKNVQWNSLNVDNSNQNKGHSE